MACATQQSSFPLKDLPHETRWAQVLSPIVHLAVSVIELNLNGGGRE